MKRLLLLTTALVALATPAMADLIRADNGVGFGGCTTANCNSFTDLDGTGFGALPRVLTLQTNTSETGSVAPNGSGGVTLTGDAIAGSDKASAPSVSGLGWTTGNQVGIGFVSDQTGNSGVTLQALTLGLFNGTTLLGSFSIAAPINYSQAELALQPGNGNAAFTFVLDATEQASWTALVAANPLAALAIGLSGSLGCAGTASATCQVTNDGPDSFVAIASPGSPIQQSIVPLPGAVWLFGSGILGLMALRKRKLA
jgi:hypothetical protein